MSASDQATRRFEMRAAYAYGPLFTPSYHVLRATGTMRNTSGNFRRRPGKCRAAATFGAQPVVTPDGVEFISLVSPQTRKSRKPGCSLQVIQNRQAARITGYPYGNIRIDPAVQVACNCFVTKSIPIKKDFRDFAGACLDTWPVSTLLVFAFSSAPATRPAPHAALLLATRRTRMEPAR